jgi:tetratricopeptide (TPR) repeat protein
LTDAALSQRSQALTLMAQVANSRGDSQTALNLYRQAMAGTAEAMRRDPTDAEAIFEHAQNVFYVGEIAEGSEDYRTAEQSMREYQQLARQMVTLQPDNLKYRMEGQYADFNLGVVLYDQRRFGEAVPQFKNALSTMEAIATADPNKKDYQQNVAEALTWLSDAQRSTGDYAGAIAARQRTAASYGQLYGKWRDVKFRERLSSSQRFLGNLYAERGQPDLAQEQLNAAIASADALIAVEPNNALWLSLAATARIALAKLLIVTGQHGDAAAQGANGCRTLEALLHRPSPRPEWRRAPYNCALIRADLAMASGNKDQALAAAQQAVVAAAQVRSSDKVEDAFRLVRAYRLVGDVEQARGDLNAAQAAWSKGLEVTPKGVAERPDEMQDHATLLQRLGRSGDAKPLTDRLRAMGYRLAI